MPDCPEGFRWIRDARKARGGYCRDIEKARAVGRVASVRYNASEKGHARDAQYGSSEKGRARDVRYRFTLKGQITQHRSTRKRITKRLLARLGRDEL